MAKSNYVEDSLDLHLFFARIMKEHALFLAVGYTDADCDFKREAKEYQLAFEELLRDVIKCSYGNTDSCVLTSGEMITEYTLCSEKATSELTASSIDCTITNMQEKLAKKTNATCNTDDPSLVHEVKRINQRCLQLLKCFIAFKQDTLDRVKKCKMYTVNYPLLIEHIIREAKLYENYVKKLENIGSCSEKDLKNEELFWNQIMMEHALFIRELLDPTEGKLIQTANNFACTYASLLKDARDMTDATMEAMKDMTLKETIKYRDFKKAGAKGINECGIKSLILPLLADHVLREANHYIRILKES